MVVMGRIGPIAVPTAARRGLAAVLLMGLLGGCAAPGKLAEVAGVEVCLNGACAQAVGKYGTDELLGGLLVMFKANEGAEAVLCEADPANRKCVRDHVSFFVQGGPIPGVSTVSRPRHTNVAIDKTTFQIVYDTISDVTWMGTPVICQDAYTAITVESPGKILIESPSYVCLWTAFAHVWNAKFAVNFIDFDNSVIGGNYAYAGAGMLVAGGGSGAFLLKLPKTRTLAAAGKARLRAAKDLPPATLEAEGPVREKPALVEGKPAKAEPAPPAIEEVRVPTPKRPPLAKAEPPKADTAPPVIETEDGLTVTGSPARISGKLSDDSAVVELLIDGKPVPFSDDGAFAFNRAVPLGKTTLSSPLTKFLLDAERAV